MSYLFNLEKSLYLKVVIKTFGFVSWANFINKSRNIRGNLNEVFIDGIWDSFINSSVSSLSLRL
jgi:hypothetical protein